MSQVRPLQEGRNLLLFSPGVLSSAMPRVIHIASGIFLSASPHLLSDERTDTGFTHRMCVYLYSTLASFPFLGYSSSP